MQRDIGHTKDRLKQIAIKTEIKTTGAEGK